MAAPVPTTVPTSIAAGDTLTFKLQFSDYGAPTWTLTFYLQKRSPAFDTIQFAATNDAGGHLVTVPAATTALWTDGEYEIVGIVTSGSEQHTVYSSLLTVTPNYSLAQQTDTRTKARKILDFIEASWLKIVQKQTVRATIEGVDLQFRSLKELQEARDYWRAEVSAEDARITGKSKRTVLAVFTAAQ